MEHLIEWFAGGLGQYVSAEIVIFIISMVPILELRGGLLAASLLGIDITTAIPLCIIGNIIPIPFILLFIKKIFKWMKRFSFFRPLVEKLEKRAESKSEGFKKGEFVAWQQRGDNLQERFSPLFCVYTSLRYPVEKSTSLRSCSPARICCRFSAEMRTMRSNVSCRW